jgi:hemoglobin
MSFAVMGAAESPYQRRAAEAGLTEAMVREVIAAFYDKVKRDPALGPVFNAIIGDDWDAHLEKIASFWLFVTRLGKGYQTRDFMPAHVGHSAIRASLLPRWLHLFRETAQTICPPEAARVLIEIADGMAESLRISPTGVMRLHLPLPLAGRSRVGPQHQSATNNARAEPIMSASIPRSRRCLCRHPTPEPLPVDLG